MPNASNSKYEIFQLGGLPPGVFGETYAIATAVAKPGKTYKGEYFLLTQRPTPSLNQGTLAVNASNVPPELLSIDLDFIIRESQQQAEVRLIDLLYQRAEALNRPDLVGDRKSVV